MKRITKTRPKPKVADVNHAHAKENIQIKMEVLASAVKRQSGQVVQVADLKYESSMAIRELLPCTVRQFNLWHSGALPDDARISLPVFTRNANKTLHSAGLFEDVKRVVEAARALSVKTSSEAHTEKLSKYKANAALAIKLRQIAEDEIVKLKQELKVANDQIDVLNRKMEQLRSRARLQSTSGGSKKGDHP